MRLKTFIWYLKRPIFYSYMVEELARKFRKPHRGSKDEQKSATDRCHGLAMSLEKFLIKEGVEKINIPAHLMTYAWEREHENVTGMGAGGPFEGLLGSLIISKNYKKILETGVATGWTSLEVLWALGESGNDGVLVSTDMPYPTKNFEKWVGCVVPPDLEKNWVLIKKPDRFGLFDALEDLGNQLDLVHYDSDKSYWGRMWAYPIIWDNLRQGGIFISDDVGDNLAYFEFCESIDREFSIVRKGESNHFVGVVKK
jgi:predicted O-methyltransferase YrrM